VSRVRRKLSSAEIRRLQDSASEVVSAISVAGHRGNVSDLSVADPLKILADSRELRHSFDAALRELHWLVHGDGFKTCRRCPPRPVRASGGGK
jgi:hypothetical protein